MTRKEKINRNIGFTFDFLRQIVDDPLLIEKIPNGSTIEFIEKDFITTEPSKGKSKRKYLNVRSQLESL